MAGPRKSSIRGTMPKGASGKPAPSTPRAPEVVADPTRPRRVIHHGLERRAALYRLRHGGALDSDLCDADPYLLKAAKFHGEPASSPCPACADPGLVTVTYVYGDDLGPYAGRIRATDELPAMSRQFGEFSVYVVEVCQRCHWNFLITTYVLGDGVPRPAPRMPRDLLE
jgi:hypothetical protein